VRTELSDIVAAGAAAGVVVATEYVFRHFILFWMPTLGTLRVNDMVVLALAYALLTVAFGRLARTNWRDERRSLGRALRDFATRWSFTPWLLGLMLALVVLPAVDQRLWAGLRLPMWVSNWRNPDVWFAEAAPLLEPVARIGVNGLLVPVAEEYLWRGLIQPRLLLAMPAAAAIGTTAVLFSLKHVLVDASWDRFLTLAAFGAICGAMAHRHTWRSSAALHLVVNTATTAVSLAMAR
jgi:membrane protease YdiL (CAAX protease family)